MNIIIYWVQVIGDGNDEKIMKIAKKHFLKQLSPQMKLNIASGTIELVVLPTTEYTRVEMHIN